MLFWKYFGFVVTLIKHSYQILGKESYEVHPEAVTWLQALQDCETVSSKLVSFNPLAEYYTRSLPNLKREIKHNSNATTSWVGDYISYEVINDQQTTIGEDDACSEIRVTTTTALNETHYIYEYLLFPANCSNSNTIICQENTTDLNITNNLEPWTGSCHGRQLWMPPFTPYYVAVDGAFGYGNCTATEKLSAIKTYWTGYRIQQLAFEIPVRGNILRCGYISLREPAILYDDCNANKSYVCLCSIRPEEQETLSSTGRYAGLVGSIIVFIVVCMLIMRLLGWGRRNRRRYLKIRRNL